MKYLSKIMKERTSLDGAMIIGICLSAILLGGLVKWAAWAGLVYGIWTLINTED